MNKFCQSKRKRAACSSQLTESLFKVRERITNCTGIFNGFNVIVESAAESEYLYNLDSYGKGSLSRGFPTFNVVNIPKILRKRQWERRKAWSRIDGEKEGEVVVLEDTTDEEAEGCESRLIEDETPRLNESLVLTLEEAFYLSFVKEILKIFHHGRNLNFNVALETFAKAQSNFIDSFIVYGHFRKKGWIPKSGLKFGADFAIYKQGPEFHHSCYTVLISSNEQFHWDQAFAANRFVEAAKKEILICVVDKGENFKADTDGFSRCKVKEFLLKRWIVSQNRTKNEISSD